MGFQFENLVLNNYPQLIAPMRIGNAVIESASPYRKASNDDGQPGLQIDLLIQTKRNAYIVEVKRRQKLGREVISEVEKKIARLGKLKNRSIRTVLVYSGELSPIVETDGFFDSIISFRSLLGL